MNKKGIDPLILFSNYAASNEYRQKYVWETGFYLVKNLSWDLVNVWQARWYEFFKCHLCILWWLLQIALYGPKVLTMSLPSKSVSNSILSSLESITEVLFSLWRTPIYDVMSCTTWNLIWSKTISNSWSKSFCYQTFNTSREQYLQN